MASPTRTLTVNIVGRTDSVDKAFKRVSKGSSLMSDRLAKGLKMGGLAFAALGGAAIAAARTLGPMIQKAADIEESLSKNKVLFGEASVAVEKWSERTTKSLGISRREALEAVGNFGALTHAMGMSGEEGSKMSMQLVDLAADMASFNNASPEETLTAIAAGLRGENEPLRRFGVLLDAATLKAKALEKGLINSTKDALTPQTKALAAYSEILEQTEVQQGDFQRTSDGLANQQKLLAATWDDLQASIGEKLQPAFLSIVTAINDHVIPALQDLVDDPSLENFGQEFGKIFYNTVLDGMDDAEKEKSIPTTFEGYLADQATDPGLAAKLANWGIKFYDSFKDGVDTAATQANILAEVKRIMDEKAVNFGQDYADAWFNAFNRRMQGFDFDIPDAEDIANEIFNPEGMAAAAKAAEEFWEVMGFTPALDEFGPPVVGGLPAITGGIDEFGPPVVGGLPIPGGIDEFGPPVVGGLPAITGGIDEFGPPVVGGLPIPGALDEFGPAKIDPVFTQEEQDYFDKALESGFFGTQGGPSQRGMDTNITVTINAPAVTGSEIFGQIDDVVRNEAQLLKEIYFI